jgi:aryl-alcohol dehydrogenase-like predicted oxidoreductase
MTELRAREVKLGPLTVSQVCFGTEHINQTVPEFGGDILIDSAMLHGVYFWDTDNAYGSQTQVAAALKKIDREKVVICSKTYGRTWEEAEMDLERTLRELNTDYLDVYLLHEVPVGTMDEKQNALQYLRKAKSEGKVKTIGLSTHSASIISEAAEMPDIEIVCAPFNREGSRIEEGGLEAMKGALKKAHDNGKGVYGIKILGKGELTYDVKGALEWAMDHDFIDVCNLGVANLSELRQNLKAVNSHIDGRGAAE